MLFVIAGFVETTSGIPKTDLTISKTPPAIDVESTKSTESLKPSSAVLENSALWKLKSGTTHVSSILEKSSLWNIASSKPDRLDDEIDGPSVSKKSKVEPNMNPVVLMKRLSADFIAKSLAVSDDDNSKGKSSKMMPVEKATQKKTPVKKSAGKKTPVGNKNKKDVLSDDSLSDISVSDSEVSAFLEENDILAGFGSKRSVSEKKRNAPISKQRNKSSEQLSANAKKSKETQEKKIPSKVFKDNDKVNNKKVEDAKKPSSIVDIIKKENDASKY